MNEDEFKKLSFNKDPISWFLDVLKNPKNPKNPYAKSVKILTNNFKYFDVNSLIEYWSNVDVNEIEPQLSCENWMYVYCIWYGFRNDLQEKDINIYYSKEKKTPQQAKEHLLSLDEMSDDQIKHFLSNSPITHKNMILINGFHRVCSMIGRIIMNETYINLC